MVGLFGAEMALSFWFSEVGPKAGNSGQFRTAQAEFGGCLRVMLLTVPMNFRIFFCHVSRFFVIAYDE